MADVALSDVESQIAQLSSELSILSELEKTKLDSIRQKEDQIATLTSPRGSPTAEEMLVGEHIPVSYSEQHRRLDAIKPKGKENGVLSPSPSTDRLADKPSPSSRAPAIPARPSHRSTPSSTSSPPQAPPRTAHPASSPPLPPRPPSAAAASTASVAPSVEPAKPAPSTQQPPPSATTAATTTAAAVQQERKEPSSVSSETSQRTDSPPSTAPVSTVITDPSPEPSPSIPLIRPLQVTVTETESKTPRREDLPSFQSLLVSESGASPASSPAPLVFAPEQPQLLMRTTTDMSAAVSRNDRTSRKLFSIDTTDAALGTGRASLRNEPLSGGRSTARRDTEVEAKNLVLPPTARDRGYSTESNPDSARSSISCSSIEASAYAYLSTASAWSLCSSFANVDEAFKVDLSSYPFPPLERWDELTRSNTFLGKPGKKNELLIDVRSLLKDLEADDAGRECRLELTMRQMSRIVERFKVNAANRLGDPEKSRRFPLFRHLAEAIEVFAQGKKQRKADVQKLNEELSKDSFDQFFKWHHVTLQALDKDQLGQVAVFASHAEESKDVPNLVYVFPRPKMQLVLHVENIVQKTLLRGRDMGRKEENIAMLAITAVPEHQRPPYVLSYLPFVRDHTLYMTMPKESDIFVAGPLLCNSVFVYASTQPNEQPIVIMPCSNADTIFGFAYGPNRKLPEFQHYRKVLTVGGESVVSGSVLLGKKTANTNVWRFYLNSWDKDKRQSTTKELEQKQ